FYVYSSRLGQNNELHIRSAGGNLDLNSTSDFVPELWSESGSVTGPLELIESGRRDVKGKIVVEPEGHVVSDDPEFPADATEGRRLQDAGAIGVIIVQTLSDPGKTRLSNLLENFRDDLPVRLTPMAGIDVPDYPSIPVVVVSSEPGRKLLTDLRK